MFYHFFQLVLLIYFYYLFTHVSVYSHILVPQRRIHVFLEHGASSNKTIQKGRSNSTFLQVQVKFLVKLFSSFSSKTCKSCQQSDQYSMFYNVVKHCSKFLALEELSLHWILYFTKKKDFFGYFRFPLSLSQFVFWMLLVYSVAQYWKIRFVPHRNYLYQAHCTCMVYNEFAVIFRFNKDLSMKMGKCDVPWFQHKHIESLYVNSTQLAEI